MTRMREYLGDVEMLLQTRRSPAAKHHGQEPIDAPRHTRITAVPGVHGSARRDAPARVLADLAQAHPLSEPELAPARSSLIAHA